MPQYAVCYAYGHTPERWHIQGAYEDGKRAAEELRDWQRRYDGGEIRWKIRKLRDDGLPDDWREREAERFTRGDYEPVPWADEEWYQPFAQEHFCHLSLKQPGKIAYTENAAKGEADRQTIIGPGRYLTRFFKDQLTADEIERFACQVSIDADACGLKITQDADEIEEVYTNGPESCMSGEADNFIGPCHPSRVYAGPDLALAYTGESNDASGRVVIWPEKKVYSTIYGDCKRLKMLLEDAGYQRGSICGARVRKIAAGYGYVMPYVDDCGSAHEDGEFIVLGGGSLDCRSTCGTTATGPICPYCGETYDEDDSYYVDEVDEHWCPSCAHETTVCEVTDERYRDHWNTFVEVNALVYQRIGFDYPSEWGYALGTIMANEDNCTEDYDVVEFEGEYWTTAALKFRRKQQRSEAAKRGWETRRRTAALPLAA